MIVKKLSEQDLNNFIKNQVPESRYLEYKSQILLDGNEKYEFCRDVAAFANTEGGHIIYGIKEENGQPIELCKITDNMDNLKTRIAQILESTLEPKLLGYSLEEIDGCLVMTIRKSWNAPHAIKLDGTQCKFQFPYRTDAGRQYYDIHTLKEKIMEYSTLITDINTFIEKHINIFCDENHNNFGKEDRISVLVHMIPISAFYNHNSIDIDSINTYSKSNAHSTLRPFKLEERLHFNAFPNLEGFRICWDNPDRHFYNQIFRNASIEACYEVSRNFDEQKNIHFIEEDGIQTTALEGVQRFMDFYITENISGPIIVSINLFNITDCHLWKRDFFRDNPIQNPLTAKRLDLGKIEIKLDEKIENSLEPLFKILYNAFGRTKTK